MPANANLTEEQEKFFRSMMHIVVNNHDKGQPYLRQAFFKMKAYNVPGIRTMAVDKYYHVYIDFDYMMNIGVDSAAQYLNHEVWHPLRNHAERIQQLPNTPPEYDREFAGNIAGDLEINDDIEDIVPMVALFPTKDIFKDYPRENTLEQYYDLILNDLERLAEHFPDLRVGESRQQQSGSESDDSQQQQSDSSDGNEDNSDSGDDSSDSGDPQNSEDGTEGDKTTDSNDGSQSDSDSEEGEGSESDAQSEGGGNSDSEDEDADESNSDSGNGDEDNSSNEQSDDQGDGENGDGSESSNSSENSERNDEDASGDGGEVSQEGNDAGTGSPTPSPSSEESPASNFHTCGSAAGVPEDYEVPPTEEEIVDAEVNNLQEKIASDIKEYVKERGNQVGSGRSKDLSRISKWAEDNLKAKYIPWKQEFRGNFRASYAKQRGKQTYSYARLSRRQPIPNVLLPGSYSQRPTVGMAIDVSGSNIANLKAILKEISNVIQQTGVAKSDVKAFAVDVGSSRVKTVTDPLKLLDDLPVGGGTRMTPGYEKLAEIAADVSLLITDGYVYDYPKEKPKGKHKKSTVFLTCIVLLERDSKSENNVVEQARKKIGSWSKVIPIYLNEI